LKDNRPRWRTATTFSEVHVNLRLTLGRLGGTIPALFLFSEGIAMRHGWVIACCLLLPAPAFAQIDCVKQGKTELAKRNYNSAIAWFTEAIHRDPENAEAYHLRGKAYQEGKGAFADAISDYSRAVRLKPDFFEAYLDRARVLEMKGEIDRAISDCNHVVYNTSKCADAYLMRGRLRLSKGQYEQAATDCTEALRLRPNDAEASRIRTAAWRALGKSDDGR
jgi:tetratricopeptide (TPR) repeat protein